MWPIGPNKERNELYFVNRSILSHAGINATVETSVVSFIGFYPTKNHLESGNYHADNFFSSNCLHTAVIVTFEYATDNKTRSN